MSSDSAWRPSRTIGRSPKRSRAPARVRHESDRAARARVWAIPRARIVRFAASLRGLLLRNASAEVLNGASKRPSGPHALRRDGIFSGRLGGLRVRLWPDWQRILCGERLVRLVRDHCWLRLLLRRRIVRHDPRLGPLGQLLRRRLTRTGGRGDRRRRSRRSSHSSTLRPSTRSRRAMATPRSSTAAVANFDHELVRWAPSGPSGASFRESGRSTSRASERRAVLQLRPAHGSPARAGALSPRES